ncbi:MAG: transglycosylase SLT domain-containing protein [Bacilli bacterium]
MALGKIETKNKNKIIKVIAGALLVVNVVLTCGYVKTNTELNKAETLIEKTKSYNKLLKDKNDELKEDLSYEVNSESDIRLIRDDLISTVKEVVKSRDREIAEIDVLRALNSTENRIMDEYIRVASLILATMETETGFKHMVHKNPNGTVDYGIMQVNEVVVPHVKEALGKHMDPINNKDHNVDAGSYEIYECYLKAKEKHPEDVIWWTYAYYNRGMYFENTEAWKNINHPSHKKVKKQADVRSEIFRECYEAYYKALAESI